MASLLKWVGGVSGEILIVIFLIALGPKILSQIQTDSRSKGESRSYRHSEQFDDSGLVPTDDNGDGETSWNEQVPSGFDPSGYNQSDFDPNEVAEGSWERESDYDRRLADNLERSGVQLGQRLSDWIGAIVEDSYSEGRSRN